MKSTSGIQVIERAAEILRQLKRDNTGQSLGTIASETGLPRSTVQRIVNALLAEGLIASSGKDGGLRLGPELQSLAAAGRIDVASIIRPALQALSIETGETVDLAVYANGRMTIVDQIPGRHRLSAVSVPGEDFPLSTTANGRAVLSLLPERDVADVFLNESADGELSTFLKLMQTVRESGVAFDIDDHTAGISAAGVTFQTVAGEIFAVSIPAPSSRFSQNREVITTALQGFLAETVAPNPYFQTDQAGASSRETV